MKKEKSCGVIVIKREDDEFRILLLEHQKGHISFPKGHVEENETEEETALREVKEETNLDVKLMPSFRKVITYSPKENVLKDVVYFLGSPLNEEVIVQEEEIKSFKWVSFKEAFDLVTHDDDKMLLNEVISYLNDFSY